jgi:uncharacterized protein with ParB-like and HNH nuclease domain
MEMNAVAKTVHAVFSPNNKYIVPRYQREYSWETSDIDDFWSDIVQQIKCEAGVPKYSEYFIGCVVFVGEDSKPDFTIVDGQQRMTTLTLLMKLIANKLRALGDQKAADALYQNVIEGKDNDGNEYFKLDSESPKPYLQNELLSPSPEKFSEPSTEEEKRLGKANDRLKKKIDDFEIEGMSGLEAIKTLRTQVLNHLKFIVVTAKDEDDASTIFETLNARGISLTSVDLIKNWVFKNNQKTHPNDNAKDLWKEVRTKVTGIPNLDMETFFLHFWNSKYGSSAADNLYKNFQKCIKDGRIADSLSFLIELRDAAQRYHKIADPKSAKWGNQKEQLVRESFEFINQYKVKQPNPFFLSLIENRDNKNVGETLFIKAVKSIELFHFIFSHLCSSRGSGLGNSYSSSARNLYSCKTKAQAEKVINELLNTLEIKLPKKAMIDEKLSELTLLGKNDKDKRKIQMVFAKIEHYLHTTNELTIQSFSIEHIQDESSGMGWVGCLGNLLPLDEKLNNEIGSGKTFLDKKNVYKKSSLLLVKHFVEMFPEDRWDEALSKKWCAELSDLIYKACQSTFE